MTRVRPETSGKLRATIRSFLAVAATVTAALSAHAHVMSMSQGTLLLDGEFVRYELRMPLLETPQDEHRDRILLGAFQVRAGDVDGTVVETSCREDRAQGLYVCRAGYRFTEPPDSVTVRCEFPSVIVPHHVHILRSGEGESARQTVFDITVREAEIRFVPPTPMEVAATAVGAGARRALTSPELLLFLLALCLAGRTRREFLACGGAFLVAQALLSVSGQIIGWNLSMDFLEAAAALTVAYLASEVLFLPEATRRWLVCGALGCIHGLFLGSYLGAAAMHPGLFLPGALGTEAILAGGIGAARLKFANRRAEQLLGLLLLVTGLGWFGLRMLG